MRPIAILGAGSWGTGLALTLARQGQSVRIWSIETAEIKAMQDDRANNRYLPGIELPAQILPLENLSETIADVDDILIVVPSSAFRETLQSIKPLLTPAHRIICATKGLDSNTGQLMSDVTIDVLGMDIKFAVLSGPSFAKEVAAGLPCAVNIASIDDDFLNDLVARFNNDYFRVVACRDVVGVELGGVIKNVIAIATGISDGLEAGASARSAIMTFGLSEVIRLSVAGGGMIDTMLGLAGVGDLILTCSDDLSRNRRLGLALGRGKDIAAAEAEIGQVVEGKRNAELVLMLAEKAGITMPVCAAVWDILQGKITPKEGFNRFFNIGKQ